MTNVQEGIPSTIDAAFAGDVITYIHRLAGKEDINSLIDVPSKYLLTKGAIKNFMQEEGKTKIFPGTTTKNNVILQLVAEDTPLEVFNKLDTSKSEGVTDYMAFTVLSVGEEVINCKPGDVVHCHNRLAGAKFSDDYGREAIHKSFKALPREDYLSIVKLFPRIKFHDFFVISSFDIFYVAE
jgi:hypothetical protein